MYLKQPASRSFLCLTWRIYDFVRSIKFQAGTRTVTICHLLVTVLYLLLWSFSLLIFRKYWFPPPSKNNTSQYLCSAAKSCEGWGHCFLVLGSSWWVSWRLAHHRCYLPAFFSRSAVPPGSLNSAFFCLRMFSLFYFYREMREIRSFPVIFFYSSFGSKGRYGLEMNAWGRRLVARWLGSSPWDLGVYSL